MLEDTVEMADSVVEGGGQTLEVHGADDDESNGTKSAFPIVGYLGIVFLVGVLIVLPMALYSYAKDISDQLDLLPLDEDQVLSGDPM